MFTISAAAARIQRELPETEAAIDEALRKAAGLMQTLALARTLTDVPATAGQPAFIRLAEVQTNLVAAAGGVQRVHGELSKVNRDVVGVLDENGECPWEQQVGQSDSRVA
jgi:hypothetical protein